MFAFRLFVVVLNLVRWAMFFDVLGDGSLVGAGCAAGAALFQVAVLRAWLLRCHETSLAQ